MALVANRLVMFGDTFNRNIDYKSWNFLIASVLGNEIKKLPVEMTRMYRKITGMTLWVYKFMFLTIIDTLCLIIMA